MAKQRTLATWKVQVASRIDGSCGMVKVWELPTRAEYFIENAGLGIAKKRAVQLAIVDGIQYPVIQSVERQSGF